MEDDDDIQDVFHNADIPDAALEDQTIQWAMTLAFVALTLVAQHPDFGALQQMNNGFLVPGDSKRALVSFKYQLEQ